MKYRRALLTSTLAALLPQAAHATVVFENAGTTDGWGRVYTQRAGTLTVVNSPVYKGGSALKMAQTYQTSDASNYHSEVVKNMAGLADQDLYYGQAIYLPADWVFHDQNVTFQQWAPEDPAGPWILMFVQKDQLRVGGKGITGYPVLASITGLRGTWIRVVTRIHQSTNGVFEVWVNGTKTLSQPGDFHSPAPSIRWSSGIYCTRWDTEMPAGQSVLAIFHDSLRIATTLAEADPASWGGATPDGGAAVADAGPVDADPADARPAADDLAGDDGGDAGGNSGGAGGNGGGAMGGSGGGSGGGATGGSSGGGAIGEGGAGGTAGRGAGGAAGDDTGGAGGDDSPPSRGAAKAGGCTIATTAPAAPGLLVLAALIALRARRRR